MTLSNYADENKLPIMDQQTFETITNEIGKEKFREDLAQYIADNRPKFPLKEISYEAMRQAFKSLQKQDVWEFVKPVELLEKNVKEKYDDYKYNFKDHGLGIIDAPSNFNDISNYFHQHLRLNCGSFGFKAPIDVWENGTAKDIWRCLGPIWRGINGMKPVEVDNKIELRGGRLDDKSYMSAFRLGTRAQKSFERSKHMFVNIMDPNIKNKRYYSSDELVDSLKDNFVGQIGMRIMQRPKSDKLFESDEEKAEFMNRIYIENVWCFSKEKLDYFRHSRRATLF
jgi:hypothetical protein